MARVDDRIEVVIPSSGRASGTRRFSRLYSALDHSRGLDRQGGSDHMTPDTSRDVLVVAHTTPDTSRDVLVAAHTTPDTSRNVLVAAHMTPGTSRNTSHRSSQCWATLGLGTGTHDPSTSHRSSRG